MKRDKVVYDHEEMELLKEIEAGEWVDTPMSQKERSAYAQNAKYTKSLQEKRQTTIRFSVQDLALIKAEAKELGIGYQNLIQTLVHNYVTGKIKLGI
jgi:predicted DNA binding CopG/RHH family protein